MRLAVAHSLDPETKLATAELAAALAPHGPPAALVVFAGIDHDHEALLAGLAAAHPGVPIVGCTTDGELSTVEGFQEDTVVVGALYGVRARRVSVFDLSTTGVAGVEAAVRAAGAQSARLCLAFTESLTMSAVDLVGAIYRVLDDDVPVVGGTAGDQWRFQRTWQFHDDRVVSDSMALLLLDGDFALNVGVFSGWAPIGGDGRVTDVVGNLVRAINGEPATRFYTRLFGEAVEYSPEHPLAVLHEDGRLAYLRAPLSSHPDGSITFAGDVPPGALVRMTHASRDEILAGCTASVTAAAERVRAPLGALVISCAARKQVLGTRTQEEVDAVTRALGGADVPVLGFYSYGEIGPMQGRTCADFHNETFVTAVFGAA